MRKILDVKEPLISCYTAYGTLFSILPKELDPWIYSNFIQLVYNELWGTYTFEGHKFLLEDCPGFRIYKTQRGKIEDDGKTLINMIRNAIDVDEYVYFFVDKYYISADKLYHGKQHFEHELLIYGYDEDVDILYVADNFADGKFAFSTCPSTDVEKGFMLLDGSKSYTEDFRTFKILRNEYPLDIKKIKHDLNAFLTSQKAYYMNKEQEMIFGVEIFDNMEKQLNRRVADGRPIDVRGFHMLYEHLLLMKERVKYMMGKKHIVEDSNLLAFIRLTTEEALLLRNLAIKYLINQNKNTLTNIFEKLGKLKNDEISIFTEILAKMG
ncbi:MAG: hypothetical protein FWC13_12540 [Oscillospiraceae bacterium]|nr:hypothetical protein [Oscillospiraceae bacterium]